MDKISRPLPNDWILDVPSVSYLIIMMETLQAPAATPRLASDFPPIISLQRRDVAVRCSIQSALRNVTNTLFYVYMYETCVV